MIPSARVQLLSIDTLYNKQIEIKEAIKNHNDSSTLRYDMIEVKPADEIPVTQLITQLSDTTQLEQSKIIQLIDDTGTALFRLSFGQISDEIVQDSFELIDKVLNVPDGLLRDSQASSNSLTKYAPIKSVLALLKLFSVAVV